MNNIPKAYAAANHQALRDQRDGCSSPDTGEPGTSAQKPVDLDALDGHSEAPWELVDVRISVADARTGFDAFEVRDAAGRVLFDSLNAEAVEVREEYSGAEDDRLHAWDEIARRNLMLAAVAPSMRAELIERRARDAAVKRLIEKAEALVVEAHHVPCCEDAADDLIDALAAVHGAAR